MTTLASEAVSRALGEPVGPWLRKHNDAGLSWRRLTAKVYTLTGYEIAHETLRSWAKQ
jgi:hypothetical protein